MSTTLSQQIKFLTLIENEVDSDIQIKLTRSQITIRINKYEESEEYLFQQLTILRAAISLSMPVHIYGIPSGHGN